MHTQSWEVLKIILSLEAHSSVRLHQRSGVGQSRVRGGAASWPSLAAVAVYGGVRECISRRAWGLQCEAWVDSPHTCH